MVPWGVKQRDNTILGVPRFAGVIREQMAYPPRNRWAYGRNMADKNQTPEQKARDSIDRMLEQAGWKVQNKKKIDFNAGLGIAVREYDTDVGPADYALFVDKKAVGVIEAKSEVWGQKITAVEEQSGGYAAAKLKWVNNEEPLPFVYESTGVITRFTDGRDPKPRSREVFNFHRPETMQEWLGQSAFLRLWRRAVFGRGNPEPRLHCRRRARASSASAG